MPKILIHNIETDEVIERDMTKAELDQFNKDQQAAELAKKQEQDKIASKNALLEKLGITDEEAKLLLG